MPADLEPLARVIEASRWMLDLAPDWDGQGSPPYAAATWERAALLLLQGARAAGHLAWETPLPTIENGPEGSIDVLWETPERQLLLNVPASPEDPIRFYGRGREGPHEVKGTVPSEGGIELIPLLLRWFSA